MEKENYKMDNTEELEDYLSLLRQYPNVFDNTAGELEIITDREILYREQEKLYAQADAKNQPHSWYNLGIVAQDEWVVVLRDLVRYPNGICGGYIRMLNRKSQLEQSGKDVVILIKCGDSLLLERHFRHDDRAWHWECPRGFGEDGLSPEENALKEIAEETSLTVKRITQINKDNDKSAYFFAECEGTFANTDKTETISDNIFVTPEKFKQMIIDGFVNDLNTIKIFALAEMQLLI